MNNIYIIIICICFVLSACATTNSNSLNGTSSLYDDAQRELAAGNTSSAKQKFSQAAKELAGGNPNANTLFILADSNFQIENYEKSQYYFGEVLKDDPSNAVAICKMGKSKFYLEFYKEALPYLQKCLDASPQNADLMYYVARSLQKSDQGVDKNSLSLYQKSAASLNKLAMWELAEIYRYNKYEQRATEQYEAYLQQGGKLNREAKEWYDGRKATLAIVSPQITMEKPMVQASQPVEQISSQPIEPISTQPVEPISTQPVEPISSQPVKQIINTPPQEKEILMVCPICGRLGEKGSELCSFDGELLEPLN